MVWPNWPISTHFRLLREQDNQLLPGDEFISFLDNVSVRAMHFDMYVQYLTHSLSLYVTLREYPVTSSHSLLPFYHALLPHKYILSIKINHPVSNNRNCRLKLTLITNNYRGYKSTKIQGNWHRRKETRKWGKFSVILWRYSLFSPWF